MTDTTSARALSVEWRRVLAVLLCVAADRVGYPRRGVRGWVTIGHLNTYLKPQRITSLAPMHDKGWVQREDARLPGAGELLVWRITPEGVREIDPDHPSDSQALRRPSGPPDPRVVLTEYQDHCFQALRATLDDPRVLPLGPGGGGWMRPKDSGDPFASPDALRQLSALGYAERYMQPRDGTTRPTSWYRLTTAGKAVRAAMYTSFYEYGRLQQVLARVEAGEPAGWTPAPYARHGGERR